MGRRLGQHFLFDPSILGRIADAALLDSNHTVLEIGPGKGPLTRELASRASRVVAIEADRKLAAELIRNPVAPNVEIITGDALRVDWPRADVICGNIPYQITTPLIERALTPPRPLRIVFLVQKEVADRLAAAPGSKQYGALSVGVQLVAQVERLFTVKAGAFAPPPKVDSAVVRLTPKRAESEERRAESERPESERPESGERRAESETRALVQALFQRRRQQLQRSLREYLSSHAPRPTHHAPDASHDPRLPTHDLIAAAGLDPLMRPEEMTPGQFLTLARLIADQ